MKKFLLTLAVILSTTCPLFGQATSGFHRTAVALARSFQGVTAQIIPNAKVTVTSTATGLAATIYSDPGLSSQITPAVVTADNSGNYGYYIPLNYCVTETITSPGQGTQIIPNICDHGVTLPIQHNGVPVVDQGLYNAWDSPASLSGGALDSGYQPVVFKTDTIGGWAGETLAANNLQTLSSPPLAGQSAIVYPTSYTTSTCGAGESAYGSNTSGGVHLGAGGTCGNAVVTWNFSSSGGNVTTASGATIPVANITAVYPFVTSSASIFRNAGGGTYMTTACAGANITLNNTAYDLINPGWTQWPLQQYNSSTSLSPINATNFNGMSCSITASVLDGGVGSPDVEGNATLVGAYVYYTGTPVSSPYNIYVQAPLRYNAFNSTLSIPLPYDGAVDVGTADNYVATNSAFSAYPPQAPLSMWFCAAHANATTTPKLNLNGWGAWTIIGPTGNAVSAGDIVACNGAAGIWAHVTLSGNGANWILQNPQTTAAGGGVTSVSTSDGSLTISPTTGAVVASINYAHTGTWTALETFNAGITLGSSSTLTLGSIMGSTQCLHVNSLGVVSGTGSDCGAGSGNMSDGSGTSTAGYFPESTSTPHSYSLYSPSQVLSQIGAAPAPVNTINETANFSPLCGASYAAQAAGSITATLPASPTTGCLIVVYGEGAGGYTVSAGSAIIFQGSTTTVTSFTQSQGQTVALTWDGTDWHATKPVTGGGGTIPSTTKMLAGNGSGGAVATTCDDGVTTSGVVTCGDSLTVGGSGFTSIKGSSSGLAALGVPAAAGTPSTLLLPTSDPTVGQILQAAAPAACTGYPTANCTQMSWTSNAAGTTVIAKPPYLSVGGTYVDSDYFPVTKITCSTFTAIGTAPSCTNGVNGDVIYASSTTGTAYNGYVSLTSAIDMDYRCMEFGGATGNAGCNVWVCDPTNLYRYIFDFYPTSTGTGFTIAYDSYAMTGSCTGTVGAEGGHGTLAVSGGLASTVHLKLSYSAGTLSWSYSINGGQNYYTAFTACSSGCTISQTVSAPSIGGYSMYTGTGGTNLIDDILSVVAQ